MAETSCKQPGQMAYIALGANLPSRAGPPNTTVRAAMDSLGALGRVLRRSSLYDTEPVGVLDQPRFVNAVVSLCTEIEPETLLDRLLAIEREFGRDRAREQSKGPRTLDLDLLMMGGMVMQTPTLVLPHPAMQGRRFVLEPLAEIAPELVHPVLVSSVADLLRALL